MSMRTLLLVSLLLIPYAHCQEFDLYAFSAGAPFTLFNFTHQGNNAEVYIMGGQIQAILMPTENGTLEPVTREPELEAALEGYYSSQGYSMFALAKLIDVHKTLQNISKNYEPGEAKCRVITGTDRTACVDYDSCQRACYTVTSFCQPIALGVGKPLINEIWAFSNSSKQLAKVYGDENVSYTAFSANASRENAEKYLQAISEINKAATKASKNLLYSDFSYCYLPDYSLGMITGLQLIAQKAYSNASKFYYVAEEAQAVRSRTLEGLSRMAEYQANQTALLPAPQNLTNYSSYFSNSTSNSTEPEIKPRTPRDAMRDAGFMTAAFVAAAFALLSFVKFAKKELKQ